MELGDASLQAQEQHAKMLERVAAEQRGRSMVVPTDPNEVQIMLRAIGEPVCFFGEGPGARRQRLQTKLGSATVARDRGEQIPDAVAEVLGAAASGDGYAMVAAAQAASGSSKFDMAAARQAAEETAALAERRKRELFYVKADEALQEARVAIAADSLARAKQRVLQEAARIHALERFAAGEEASAAAESFDTDGGIFASVVDEAARASCVLATLPRLRPVLSENAGDRPLQGIDWSRCGRALVVGGFGAVAQVWDARKLRRRATLRGHEDRVVDAQFHPQFGAPPFDPASGRAAIATASADCTAGIWAAGQETPLARLRGHSGRLAAVRWHPLGAHLLTSSHDETVRLWDAGTGRCLQVQEGHHRQVHGLAVHPDGGLFASGDFAGGVRLWDLRSGQCVWVVAEVRRRTVSVLGGTVGASSSTSDGAGVATAASISSFPSGASAGGAGGPTGGGGGGIESVPAHATQVTSLDFHPDGRRLASAGADGAVKVWDLRACKKLLDLAGHSSVVTSVQFAPRTGSALLSSSMDGSVRFWGSDRGEPLGRVVGHDGRIMGATWRGTDDARVATIGYDRTLKVWAHDMDF